MEHAKKRKIAMKKEIIALVAALAIAGFSALTAQNHNPKLPPVGKDPSLTNYSTNQTGFWAAAQLSGAYSAFLGKHNTPAVELDAVGGYRFSQWLRVGVGIGARYYIENSKLRSNKVKWAMPLYVNARGNFMDDTYRTVVPYWSFDLGGTVRDSYMIRPTLGLRIGQARSAFLVGVTYTAQRMKYVVGDNRTVSMVGLTLGYEY